MVLYSATSIGLLQLGRQGGQDRDWVENFKLFLVMLLETGYTNSSQCMVLGMDIARFLKAEGVSEAGLQARCLGSRCQYMQGILTYCVCP